MLCSEFNYFRNLCQKNQIGSNKFARSAMNESTLCDCFDICNFFLKILAVLRSALDERTLHFQRSRRAQIKTESSKKSRKKSIFHGPVEPDPKPMKKDELSFVHEAFQYLCKTFVGEVITNTETNKKPPFLKTDIIKSEIIADPNAADSGAAKSKKKKKSSQINSEDMKVRFADDIINSDHDDETDSLEKAKNSRQFCAKRYYSSTV